MTNQAPAPVPDFGDLLDFEPVPRKINRVDGWTPEAQRAFVRALSLTGSRDRAAKAVGKSESSISQLLRSDGAESFGAACEAALAIAAGTAARRLNAGLEAVQAQAAARAPSPGQRTRGRRSGRPQSVANSPAAPTPPLDAQDERDLKAKQFAGMMRDYLIKVGEERKARLRGEITAADFYLRQLTFIEVMLDMGSADGLFRALKDFREEGYLLIDIAQTPMSKFLDDARRHKWAEMGDPPRPAPVPPDLLEICGRFDVEPTEYTRGGDISRNDQLAAFRARYAKDAVEQLEWEAEARRDYERRRAGAADS